NRMTQTQRDRLGELLRRAGVSLDDAQALNDAGQVNSVGDKPAGDPGAVAATVAGALRGGGPRPRVAAHPGPTEVLLRPAADPVGGHERLTQVCPPGLIDEFCSPAPVPRAAPWLPAVGLLATALAGLAGVAAAAIAAVAWTALASVVARPISFD